MEFHMNLYWRKKAMEAMNASKVLPLSSPPNSVPE